MNPILLKSKSTIAITMETDILSVDRWAFYLLLTSPITANAPGNGSTFKQILVNDDEHKHGQASMQWPKHQTLILNTNAMVKVLTHKKQQAGRDFPNASMILLLSGVVSNL